MKQAVFEIALRGPGREPVDLWRTLTSHGVASLPPMALDEDARTLEVTLPLRRCRPRRVRIGGGRSGRARVVVLGPPPGPAMLTALKTQVAHVLRLDADLSGFYSRAADDPDLAWATAGAGRMIRSPTVFEDVVKTICTTNCSWGATTKMVRTLVERLGEAPAGRASSADGARAFPTAAAMAEVDERFYREVVRAGYRGPYLHRLARDVASGDLDLEALAVPADDLPDDEVELRLLALPGIGPYAAAHIMMMLGRYSRLILDSWTRPKYARLVGRRAVADATIVRRFKPYGPYAGLAFWLFLTRDWVE